MDACWLSGRVVRGLQNGRTFGFPTINIDLDEPDSLTDSGVFVTEILLDDTHYYGMLYVGTRPTLDLQTKTVEINIFNFNADCYGKKVSFKPGKKIREERRFASLNDLVDQLKKDKDEIRKLLNH